MAWTPPRTYTTSELITSTILNVHVRDNFLAINSIPAARVYHNADQGPFASGGTWHTIAFNSERYDTDVIHGTPNTDLFCKTAGKYDAGGIASVSGVAGGLRGLRILHNGTTPVAQMNVPGLVSGNTLCVHTPGPVQLAVNDFLQLQMTQDSGSNVNVLAIGNFSPEFGMQRTSE